MCVCQLDFNLPIRFNLKYKSADQHANDHHADQHTDEHADQHADEHGTDGGLGEVERKSHHVCVFASCRPQLLDERGSGDRASTHAS